MRFSRLYSRIGFMLFILLAVGCTIRQGSEQFTMAEIARSTPTVLPTLQSRPDFIHGVAPQEYAVIPLTLFRADKREQYLEETGIYLSGGWGSAEGGYRSSVCVDLDLEPLVQAGDDFTEPDLVLDRIMMEVDDRKLNEVLDYSSLPTLLERGSAKWTGPIAFCWVTDIGPGVHTATITFRLTSGETRQYSWQFVIDDSS